MKINRYGKDNGIIMVKNVVLIFYKMCLIYLVKLLVGNRFMNLYR